jgi:hypothetical protein
MGGGRMTFPFRPWVRRAGLSIVLVAGGATAAMIAWLLLEPGARYGWLGERAVWLYVGTLWLGGLKVWVGTLRPIAELEENSIVLRPLHTMRRRTVAWNSIRGTEQMIGGDRMIVYYDTPRGLRYVALNLNLVKGRRDFLAQLDARLRLMGFVERSVGRSRFLASPERREQPR